MKHKKGYTLEADLMPIMLGHVALPNFKEETLECGVAIIASGGALDGMPDVMRVKIPGIAPQGTWARYFLIKTQAGNYDGGGYVMFWDQGKGRIMRFAICEHKFLQGAGANPSRGWNPGHCDKCGLDMTVDSSD